MKEKIFHISTQDSIIIYIVLLCLCLSHSSHFLSLFSHILSFSASLSLSPSLVYLLSQPRKSRDYQRNNPSGRGLLLPASVESLLFFPLLFPFVLSYFLSEAGGEDLMMGDIPLLVWKFVRPLNIQTFLVFSLFDLPPTKVCSLSTILLSLLAVLYLFNFYASIRPDL